MAKQKIYPVNPVIKTYYIYDRQGCPKTKRFSSKEDFVLYLAKKTVYSWFNREAISFNEIKDSQNFSGTDKKVFMERKSWYEEKQKEWVMIYEKKYLDRRFTFYYETVDNRFHILDIKSLEKEVMAAKEMEAYRKSGRYNWCRKKYHGAYQERKKYRKNYNKYEINPEEMEEFKGKSRRKRGLYKTLPDFNCYSKSEKCWKKQTKNPHQYGRRFRDKWKESEYISDIINEDLLECDFDNEFFEECS